jgi:hypothetical protein
LLISFSPDNKLVTDTFGKPQLRLCNFELVRPIPPASGDVPTGGRAGTGG